MPTCSADRQRVGGLFMTRSTNLLIIIVIIIARLTYRSLAECWGAACSESWTVCLTCPSWSSRHPSSFHPRRLRLTTAAEAGRRSPTHSARDDDEPSTMLSNTVIIQNWPTELRFCVPPDTNMSFQRRSSQPISWRSTEKRKQTQKQQTCIHSKIYYNTKYTHKKLKPVLVASYDLWPGNGTGQFLWK